MNQSDQTKQFSINEFIIILQDGKLADDAVIDIDANTSDPVTVSDYANEIFVNMKKREVIRLGRLTFLWSMLESEQTNSVKIT